MPGATKQALGLSWREPLESTHLIVRLDYMRRYVSCLVSDMLTGAVDVVVRRQGSGWRRRHENSEVPSFVVFSAGGMLYHAVLLINDSYLSLCLWRSCGAVFHHVRYV